MIVALVMNHTKSIASDCHDGHRCVGCKTGEGVQTHSLLLKNINPYIVKRWDGR
jgi:hypothetical protein